MSTAQNYGVTVEDVREIMDTTLAEGALETAIMAGADVASDELDGIPVSDQRRTLIVTYLACHFATAGDPSEKEASVGDTRWNYERDDDGTGIGETRYGRRAIDLDPTGRLAKRDAEEPEFEVFGISAADGSDRRGR